MFRKRLWQWLSLRHRHSWREVLPTNFVDAFSQVSPIFCIAGDVVRLDQQRAALTDCTCNNIFLINGEAICALTENEPADSQRWIYLFRITTKCQPDTHFKLQPGRAKP